MEANFRNGVKYPIFKHMLNQRILTCWVLICLLFGAPSYTGTNLMFEVMFILYYSLQFLFYLYVAYTNSCVVGCVASSRVTAVFQQFSRPLGKQAVVSL